MRFPYKTASMTRKVFGTRADGTQVGVWYLANRRGLRAEVLELGGIVHRLVVIGGDLKKHDVVLGARDLAAYEEGTFAAAALRSPIATTELPVMEAREEDHHLVLRARCAAGPGAQPDAGVELHVALTDADELVIGREVRGREMRGAGAGPCGCAAVPTAPCGMPLYFNLAGQEPGNVLDHALAVDAGWYADAGEPGSTGAGPQGSHWLPAEGTPADFREGKALADAILLPECLGGEVAGFDYCLLVDRGGDGVRGDGADGADGNAALGACGEAAEGLTPCATAYCGRSRVYLDVSTDAPAVRLTTFQPPAGVPVEGKGRVLHGNHSGCAVEPVALRDDAPPASGTVFSTIVAYRFTVDYPEGYHTDSACLDRIL